jgi:hypothetical protein
LFSLGGGLVQFDRRYELIADGPTTLEVVARDGNFIVETLKLVEYGDTPPSWEADRTLNPARIGEKYSLDGKTTNRLSFRSDQRDNSVDGSYLNFRNLGDATVRIIGTTEGERWHITRAARWTDPIETAVIAPGNSQKFCINDTSRLFLETGSGKELTLDFSNPNILHSLRLVSVEDGAERIVANIGQAQAAAAGTTWAPGANLVSAQITIRKDRPAIVQQGPL